MSESLRLDQPSGTTQLSPGKTKLHQVMWNRRRDIQT